LGLNGFAQRQAGTFDTLAVGMFMGIHQAFVFFFWKLRIDGQPHHLVMLGRAWQTNRKLNLSVTTWHSFNVASILLGRHAVFDQAR